MFDSIFWIVVILLFVVLAYFFFFRGKWFKYKTANSIEGELVQNKVEKVFKLVLAEGFFSEIVDFRNKDKKLFGLVSSTKKSLIIVDAKVLVGFDFKKVKYEVNQQNRHISFTHIPEPEILSMETDFKFYDINNGILNKFRSEDYTEVLKVGKEHIKSKVGSSELMNAAKSQLSLLLNQVAESSGLKIENLDDESHLISSVK